MDTKTAREWTAPLTAALRTLAEEQTRGKRTGSRRRVKAAIKALLIRLDEVYPPAPRRVKRRKKRKDQQTRRRLLEQAGWVVVATAQAVAALKAAGCAVKVLSSDIRTPPMSPVVMVRGWAVQIWRHCTARDLADAVRSGKRRKELLGLLALKGVVA